MLTPRFDSGIRDMTRETLLDYHKRITSRLSRGACELVIRKMYQPLSDEVTLQLVGKVKHMASPYIETKNKLLEATGRLPHDARLDGKIYGVLATNPSSTRAPFPFIGNEERRSTTGS